MKETVSRHFSLDAVGPCFILSTYKSCSWESFSILPWHFPPSFIRLTDFLILGHELKSFLFVGILQSGQKRKRLLVQGAGTMASLFEKAGSTA